MSLTMSTFDCWFLHLSYRVLVQQFENDTPAEPATKPHPIWQTTERERERDSELHVKMDGH